MDEAGIDALDTVDVFVTTSYTERTEAEYAAIRDRVAAGGGLLQGGHAWYRACSNDDVAEAYPGNRILNAMGITITEATVDAGTDTDDPEPPSDLFHAGKALAAIEAHLDGSATLGNLQQRNAADTVGDAVQLLPFSFADYFDRVRALPDRVEPVVPTVDATYAGMDDDYWYAGAGEPVWRGTGLYVPPGEVVTVTLPAGWEGQGLSARIGAHPDTLWHLGSWSRHPDVSRVWEFAAAETRIASGFGGPLYVRVPAGLALGEGELTVAGAVEYARFVTGADPAAFRVRLDDAPVAEFEGARFILTVPAAEVPAGTAPQALVGLWDRVLADDAYLAEHGDWGAFHELGHNHQYGPLNLPGTTECTVNLWSVRLGGGARRR